MAMKLSTRDIAPVKEREVFFDANILIYIFWHTGQHTWEQHYSTAFNKLLKQGNTLIIDFVTISEFISRAFKIEYEKYIQTVKYLPFKEFRNSEDGENLLNDIYTIVKEDILKIFEVAAKRFFKPDIVKLLVADTLDFNDKAILNLCKENNYVLLTNDIDFKFSDVDIMSSNPLLLK